MKQKQVHTAIHIVFGIVHRNLGKLIKQERVEIKKNRAYIYLSHYKKFTDQEIDMIETESNKAIDDNIDILIEQVPYLDSISKYGYEIYQCQNVPTDILRIVTIPDISVEVCTEKHVRNTKEVGQIRVVDSKRIHEGLIRLEIIVFDTTSDIEQQDDYNDMVSKMSKILDCTKENIITTSSNLFVDWKRLKKIYGLLCYANNVKETDPTKYSSLITKVRDTYSQLKPKPQQKTQQDLNERCIVSGVMDIFKTQKEHTIKTMQRFKNEKETFNTKIQEVCIPPKGL
jgi:alanyl-tRNA synthetase